MVEWPKSGEVAPLITKLLGVPLIVRKLPPNPLWKNDTKFFDRYDNPAATYLHCCADVNNPQWWGVAGPEWQREVGSVIVLREDGKDISREQVWAIMDFCRFYLTDYFESSTGTTKAARETMVQRYICKKRFEKWLVNFKEEMVEGEGDWWADFKSPYNE